MVNGVEVNRWQAYFIVRLLRNLALVVSVQQLCDSPSFIVLLVDQLVLKRKVLCSVVEMLEDLDRRHRGQGHCNGIFVAQSSRFISIGNHCILIANRLNLHFLKAKLRLWLFVQSDIVWFKPILFVPARLGKLMRHHFT